MTIIQQVKNEYKESFREVVTGYAEMGYSMALVASVLEVDYKRFRHLVKRFGLRDHFDRKKYNDVCKPKGKGWEPGRSRANELRYVVRRNGGEYRNKSRKELRAMLQ
jgi:hypothetical protein